MKKNKLFLLVALFAAVVLVLAACGGNDDTDPVDTGDDVVYTPTTPENGDDNGDDEVVPGVVGLGPAFQPLQDALDYHGITMAVNNDNPLIDGGILHFGSGVTGPPTWDHFDSAFWTWSSENDIRNMFTHEPLLFVGQDGFPASGVGSLAEASFDRESQTVTITKLHASTWSDGVPLTLADVVYHYYFLTSPYFNVDGNFIGRHTLVTPNWQNIVGMCAHVLYLFEQSDTYSVDVLRDHAGCGGVGVLPEESSPTITGLTLSEDEMELVIEFYDVNPFTYAFAFLTTPMPRHHWEGIPHGERRNHPNARENVLGNGPFIIDGIVPEESISFVRNENYWRGPAQLDGVIFQTFPVMTAPDVARAGMFDIINFPQSLFTPENRVMDNISFLSNPFGGTSTSWLMFNMGEWDAETGTVVPWETPRLSATVRTALMLAMDHVTPGIYSFNGLVVPSGSVYWPLNRMDLINPAIDTFSQYDLDGAIAMLEEAGYVVPAGEDFRVRPDGSPLTVIWLETEGSVANNNTAMFHLEGWRYDLQIDVQFYGGDLQPWSVTADYYLDQGNRDIDIFWRGIGFGAQLSPHWGFGHNSNNNVLRYTNAQWQYIVERFESEDMWDPAFTAATIEMWEQAFIDARVAFPQSSAIPLTAVNNRVANFSVQSTFGDLRRPGSQVSWLWGLTADTPYQASN